MSENLHKRDVIRLVEDWYYAREESEVRPKHPLCEVRELHLAEGGGGVYAKETRPSGRSRPPIRDMRGGVQRTDRTMSHIKWLDSDAYRILELYTVAGKIEDVAKVLRESPSKTFRKFDEAVAMFKGAFFLV